MSTYREATVLWQRARQEVSEPRAISLYEDAHRLLAPHIETNSDALLLWARIGMEMTLEPSRAATREKYVSATLRTLGDSYRREPLGSVADEFARQTVAATQQCERLTPTHRQRMLADARRMLDDALNQERCAELRAVLLARQSAVLRAQARLEITSGAQAALTDRALRCVERAAETGFRLKDGPAIWLEHAHAQWANIALADKKQRVDDLEYEKQLGAVEETLTRPELKDFEPARLALPMFYRLTYRSRPACEAFPAATSVVNLRRLLRNTYIYAEAAAQLWYKGYPPEVVCPYLVTARELLVNAAAAGYGNARVLTSLCFMNAMLGDTTALETTLRRIYAGPSRVNWGEALRLACTYDRPSDLVTRGFVMGIEQASIRTKLGTLVLDFMHDPELAELLHRTAVRWEPRNAIALTNLARLLLGKQTYEARDEADSLLSRAQNFADPRFRWWRELLDQVALPDNTPTHDVTQSSGAVATCADRPPARKYSDLRRQLRDIEQITEQAVRGRQFERFFANLLGLVAKRVSGPYRLKINPGESPEVDGYFEIGGHSYRLETKWLAEQVTKNDIVLFMDKLNVTGVTGLFVSMSGFTSSAISAATRSAQSRRVLLMDGDEVRWLALGVIAFEEVIDIKRYYFDKRSLSYHQVRPAVDAAFNDPGERLA